MFVRLTKEEIETIVNGGLFTGRLREHGLIATAIMADPEGNGLYPSASAVGSAVKVSFYRDVVRAASFTLASLPGCCGVLVSTATAVDCYYRNKGLGQLMQDMKREIALQLAVGMIICTTVNRATKVGSPQHKLLTKNEWKELNTFTNGRTRNKLQTWARIVYSGGDGL